jgi:predicted nucleic acid-binding protein
LKDLKDSLPEEWRGLLDNPDKLKPKISKIARELPAEVYELVRDQIIAKLLAVEDPSLAILEFVVDSNIIISDAFRVGFGKFSSTERIFSSVFVKLYAPRSIKKEVYSKIKADIPKGCNIELALKQADKLLSKIELIDDSEFEIEFEGMAKFESEYKNDVSFLKVGLGIGVKGIISRDKDFKRDGLIRTFELGAATQMIVTAESGALSITVVGASVYIGGKALYWILYILYKAIVEIFSIIAAIGSGGIAAIAGLFGRVPSWVWYLVLIALGGFVGALIISKDFRDRTGESLEKAYDFGKEVAGAMLDVLTNFFNGITALAVAFKDEFGKDFLNLGIGLTMTIVEMEQVLSGDALRLT